MNLFASLVLFSAVMAAAVTDVAHGLPAPGKTDAAKIQKNMAKTKAKKTQEVLQFGNQQNRQADARNYARAEKRQAPDDRHDPEPVPEVNNALDRYPQAVRHEKIADLFYNPDSYALQSLDADDRYKRNAYHFGSPVKRSGGGSRVYRSYADSGRAKRDLDIDPEDLLALMTLVEAERKQKAREQSRGSRQHYGRLNEYETSPYIDSEIQDEDDEEDVPEGWLEGPVEPAPFFVSPKYYYDGYARKQRALHGSKGLSRYQEEPQNYRLADYYRHYNF